MKTKLILLFLSVFSWSFFAQQGQLVGLTEKGGVDDVGVIYKVSPSQGTAQVLKEFSINEGAFPRTENLCEANNGKLYGLTSHGGEFNNGIVFEYDFENNTYTKKIDLNATLTGSNPLGGMIKASNGRLYGMCANGGVDNWGTIYEYVPETNTLTKLADFTDVNDPDNHGGLPWGNLIEASNGKLYGLTSVGGSDVEIGGSGGVLFEFDISTGVITKLYDFVRNSEGLWENGRTPYGSLLQADDGHLYGLTNRGGDGINGVIFKFDIATSTFSKIYDFEESTGINGINGENPHGTLIQASNGMLYGTTRLGGSFSNGTVFEFDITSNTYTKKLDFLSNTTGNHPVGDLLEIGNTFYCLSKNALIAINKSDFSFTVIERFLGGHINSYFGQSSPMLASNGKVYGLTTDTQESVGGGDGFGTLFEYDIESDSFETKLFIGKSSPEGGLPKGKIIQSSSCTTYGVTREGGNYNQGVIFQFDAETNEYEKLIDFKYYDRGKNPVHIIQASNGNLYGTTENGGLFDRGVLYEYNTLTQTFTKLKDFDDSGNNPSYLIELDNSIYGVNQRQLYKYNLATNTYSILKDFFSNPSDGNDPRALFKTSNNMIYGVTASGGANGVGVIYEYNTNTDTFLKRYDFLGGTSAFLPEGDIAIDENNVLYGSTLLGGSNNSGTFYKFDLNSNTFTLLHSFLDNPTGVSNVIEDKIYVSSIESDFSLGTYFNGELYEFDLSIPNPTPVVVNQFSGSNGSAPFSSVSEILIDTDSDGTPDCRDECPTDPDKIVPGECGCGTPDTDTDEDGTPDCNDLCPEDPNKIEPGECGCGIADVDTDNDGTLDCNDLCPEDPDKIEPGECGCGVPDIDTDGDGTLDCNDLCPTDPDKVEPGDCGCGIPDTDTDGDGTPDCNDLCPTDPDKIEPGDCGCGVPDTDTDGDGTPDCNDLCPIDPDKVEPGDCGCGVPDTDTDGDGTPDCNDLCPTDPDKIEPGDCGCGVPDTDTDGDGTPDCNDLCPTDPNKIIPGDCGCGIPDNDTDGDGTPDCNDLCPTDPDKTTPGDCGCGVPDMDTDGDGTPDCNDLCPTDPDKIEPGDCGCGVPDTDTDGDGTPDCNDLCPNDPDKIEPGDCGCGVPDTDTDGDGTPDCNDLCPTDPDKVEPGECGCGVPDTDTDGDGTPDCNDLCPTDPDKVEPGDCGCGVPDTDTDGDGTPDCIDNCDSSLIGTPCDDGNDCTIDDVYIEDCGCEGTLPDSDNDTVPDCEDICPGFDDLADADGDTIPDGCDPCNDLLDTDGDGTPDCNDLCPTDPDKTEPGDCGCGVPDTDTDGDGTPDCNDLCPTDPNKIIPGDCGCGIPDNDTDGDGTPDCNDLCPTDPDKTTPGDCGCGVPDMDTDGDGTPDCNDLCPTDPDKIEPGDCGCGVPDTDTDGDGTPDCNDLCPNDPDRIAPGDCGCGVPDTDTDGDGTPDCNDLCPNDPDKIEPGDCGCGVPDTDTDGDGTPDCNDLCPTDTNKVDPGDCGCGIPDTDTDGDGTPDCNDLCPNDPDKVEPGDCGCGIPDTDTDGDGTPDCNDQCDVTLIGTPCDDGNPCTVNDVYLENCDCEGILPDSDNDTVPDCEDICPGFDDLADSDGNGIPDGCESIYQCETAFAKSELDATCFIDDSFDRWGWTNYFGESGTYHLDLYSGAAHCDESRGAHVGYVEIDYDEDDLYATYNLFSGYVMTEAHLYVGCDPYPTKGRSNTVAPGHYTFVQDNLDNLTSYQIGPIDVSNLNSIHVIAHAVVCKSTCFDCVEEGTYLPNKNRIRCSNRRSTNEPNMNIYPNPVKQSLTLDIKDIVITNAKVSVYDKLGQLVYQDLNVNKNNISIEISKYITEAGVYFIFIEQDGVRLQDRFIFSKK